ncbi:Uncharacterised protein [Burkholderia pseudomallei]|nr:Uncharacterised protein [Burkholderia pseudomallei]
MLEHVLEPLAMRVFSFVGRFVVAERIHVCRMIDVHLDHRDAQRTQFVLLARVDRVCMPDLDIDSPLPLQAEIVVRGELQVDVRAIRRAVAPRHRLFGSGGLHGDRHLAAPQCRRAGRLPVQHELRVRHAAERFLEQDMVQRFAFGRAAVTGVAALVREIAAPLAHVHDVLSLARGVHAVVRLARRRPAVEAVTFFQDGLRRHCLIPRLADIGPFLGHSVPRLPARTGSAAVATRGLDACRAARIASLSHFLSRHPHERTPAASILRNIGHPRLPSPLQPA